MCLGVVGFCGLLAEGAMADWSAVYLSNVLGTSAGTAALGFTSFSFAMAAGRFAGDGVARRWGAVVVLRSSGTIAALGLVLGLLLHNAAAAVVGFGLVGLGISNIVPLVFSAAGRVKELQAGTALAAVGTVGYFGWLAGPPTIGLLSEAMGLSWGLGVVSAACALVAVSADVVGRIERGTTAPAVLPVSVGSGSA